MATRRALPMHDSEEAASSVVVCCEATPSALMMKQLGTLPLRPVDEEVREELPATMGQMCGTEDREEVVACFVGITVQCPARTDQVGMEASLKQRNDIAGRLTDRDSSIHLPASSVLLQSETLLHGNGPTTHANCVVTDDSHMHMPHWESLVIGQVHSKALHDLLADYEQLDRGNSMTERIGTTSPCLSSAEKSKLEDVQAMEPCCDSRCGDLPTQTIYARACDRPNASHMRETPSLATDIDLCPRALSPNSSCSTGDLNGQDDLGDAFTSGNLEHGPASWWWASAREKSTPSQLCASRRVCDDHKRLVTATLREQAPVLRNVQNFGPCSSLLQLDLTLLLSPTDLPSQFSPRVRYLPDSSASNAKARISGGSRDRAGYTAGSLVSSGYIYATTMSLASRSTSHVKKITCASTLHTFQTKVPMSYEDPESLPRWRYQQLSPNDRHERSCRHSASLRFAMNELLDSASSGDGTSINHVACQGPFSCSGELYRAGPFRHLGIPNGTYYSCR